MIRFLKIVVDLLSVLKTSLGYLGVGQSDSAAAPPETETRALARLAQLSSLASVDDYDRSSLVQQHEKVAYKTDVETPTNTAINHLPTTHFHVDALLAIQYRSQDASIKPGIVF